jgi:hypothetical protein
MYKTVVGFLAILLVSSISPAGAADEPVYQWKTVIKQKARLSTRWAFVVDTSDSIAGQGLFGGIIQAYRMTVQSPQDELRFCMYAFNNEGCHTYRKWEQASPDAFNDAVKWLYKKENQGTMSFGVRAIGEALTQPQKGLTVIIITDGGFTEGGEEVKKRIEEVQKWRVLKGYGRAVICTIGIENMLCRPYYPKPSNKTCQGWLKDIGKKGEGGYYYVYKREEKAHKKER